jgi:hypothetical protein
MTIPHQRPVMFDVMADDGTYFVLTEALREFAARQRWEAEDDPTGNAESRVQWAECAEGLLDRIEQEMSQTPGANPAEQLPAADRVVLRSELEGLVRTLRAWEETARACVCPPGLCSRRGRIGYETGVGGDRSDRVSCECDPSRG